MNTLKEVIEEMESDFSREDDIYKNSSLPYSKWFHGGFASALEKYIPKLKILNGQPSAQGKVCLHPFTDWDENAGCFICTECNERV